MNVRGFTLIEVLTALAIVAVALLASLRAVGVMGQSATELHMRLLAQLSARNHVGVLRATKAFPAIGITATACPQGNLAMSCRTETKSTPNEFFRRVEVRVYAESDPEHQLAYLVGILPKVR